MQLYAPFRPPRAWPSTPKHRFCHLCGRRLHGSYVKYDNGLVICSRCHSELPRCSTCGIPSRSLQPIAAHSTNPLSAPHPASPSFRRGDEAGGPGEARYCAQCLARMPRCHTCGRPIATSFLRVGDSPEAYCRDCMLHRPHCDVCGAPLGPGSQILPDNQSRCAACASTAVYHEAEAQQLYKHVVRAVTTTLGLRVAGIPVLHVVPRHELDRLRSIYTPSRTASPFRSSPEPSGIPAGPPQHLLGFFAQRNRTTAIYVEYGLPRGLLIGTLAHEFGHAWQAEHCPRQQSAFRREGFAEWVSYHVLLALGYTREAARATRREDIYGRGLRHFLEIERRADRISVLADAQRP